MVESQMQQFNDGHVSRATGVMNVLQTSLRGDFWALFVNILVFPSPIGFIMTSFSFLI